MLRVLIAKVTEDAAKGAGLSPEVELALRLVAFIGAVLGALATAVAFFLKRHWDKKDTKLKAAHEHRLALRHQEWATKQSEWKAARERELTRKASRDRLRDILYASLRWFEEGTQRRSIGISVVEASWDLFPEFRTVWLGVLTNQAVYLLA